jgi:hypothetical protein
MADCDCPLRSPAISRGEARSWNPVRCSDQFEEARTTKPDCESQSRREEVSVGAVRPLGTAPSAFRGLQHDPHLCLSSGAVAPDRAEYLVELLRTLAHNATVIFEPIRHGRDLSAGSAGANDPDRSDVVPGRTHRSQDAQRDRPTRRSRSGRSRPDLVRRAPC